MIIWCKSFYYINKTYSQAYSLSKSVSDSYNLFKHKFFDLIIHLMTGILRAGSCL